MDHLPRPPAARSPFVRGVLDVAAALGLSALLALALAWLAIGPAMRVSAPTTTFARVVLVIAVLYLLGVRWPASSSARGFRRYVAGVVVSTALAVGVALHVPAAAGLPGDARQRLAHGFALLGAITTGTYLVGRHTARRPWSGRRIEAATEEPFALRVTLAASDDEDRPPAAG